MTGFAQRWAGTAALGPAFALATPPALAQSLPVPVPAIGQPPAPAPTPVPDDDDTADTRIVKGEPAPPNSAPWQVELFATYQYTDKDLADDAKLGDRGFGLMAMDPLWERPHKCGGAYIGDNWVLTAAHCVKGAFGDPTKARRARLGTQNLAEGGALYALERVVVHKDYRSDQAAGPPVHDIALVRIVPFSPGPPRDLEAMRIRPLDPGRGDRPIGRFDLLRVTGWGLTGARNDVSGPNAADGTRNTGSPILQQVTITQQDQVCAVSPDYQGFDPKTMICAGSAKGRDSCNGDSGGPMTRAQGRDRVLVGLVSWGIGCGLAGKPGIYTRVDAYLTWIARAKAKSKPGQMVER